MKKGIYTILAILLAGAMLLASCASDTPLEDSSSSGNSTVSESDSSDPNSNDSVDNNSSNGIDASSTDSQDEFEPNESSSVSQDSTSSESDVSSEETDESSDESEPNDGSESNSNTSSGSNETSSADVSSMDTPSKNPSESSQSNPTHFHNYNNFEVVEATCTKEGYAGYICECGEGQILERFPKVDHSMIFGEVVNPTQTKRGEKILKCAYGCGKTETVELYSYVEFGRLISDYALQYINQYRAEEGAPKLTVSKKITEFSEYRGQQALQGKDHRSHNDVDSAIAAEALKCGRFFDFTDYNEDTGEPIYPHWRADGQEAWGGLTTSSWVEVGNTSIAENVGKRIANGFRGSSGHWAYVGGKSSTYKDYIYVGIGVSVDNSGYVNCYVVVNKYNPDVMGYKHITMDENGRLHEEWVKP